MCNYDSDHSEDNNSTNINTTTNHTTTHLQQNQNNHSTNNTPNSNTSMVGAASPNNTNQIDQKPYITNNNNLTNASLLHSSSSIASASSPAVLPGQTSSLSSHFSHYSSAYPNVTSSTGVGLHNSTPSSINTTGGLTNPVSTSSYSHQPTSAAPQHSAHHMSYMGYSSLDVKPSHLADWYSHAGMTSMAMHGMAATTPGMTSAGGRYDPNPHHAGKVPYHVAAALPTPPSTGHSPIQSLSNHLNLLPSTTSAVAYT